MKKISAAVEQALFERNRGYYRVTEPIGKNADFITAPEISQVFGELIAAYVTQIAGSKKSAIALVEMGAGNGTMFSDVLNAIKKLVDKNSQIALDFVSRTTFHIIEISEKLKEKQQQKLANSDVIWHKDFADFVKFPAVKNSEFFFIANELFDCFPIDQFVKTDIGWCERMIDVVDGEKVFKMAEFSPQNHQLIEKEIGIIASQKAPFGAVFERSSAAQEFMSHLSNRLTEQGGMAIIIDYGYDKYEFANTLQAVKNHQKVDVLENLESADITALVDFVRLEKIANEIGLNSSLVTQREFLLGLGIEERREILLREQNELQQAEINSAIERLIAPNQMGELFRVLMIWK